MKDRIHLAKKTDSIYHGSSYATIVNEQGALIMSFIEVQNEQFVHLKYLKKRFYEKVQNVAFQNFMI